MQKIYNTKTTIFKQNYSHPIHSLIHDYCKGFRQEKNHHDRGK